MFIVSLPQSREKWKETYQPPRQSLRVRLSLSSALRSKATYVSALSLRLLRSTPRRTYLRGSRLDLERNRLRIVVRDLERPFDGLGEGPWSNSKANRTW